LEDDRNVGQMAMAGLSLQKNLFGHANNQEIRHSGALPEIDMTWI
jgi:hypothetical protein